MTETNISTGAQWLVVALVAMLWFVMLGYRDLAEPDEGRYAEIPREMVASGDWVTPRLNGFKYFEKPAFQYWMTAATFTLFGESNTSSRLWVALISFLGALWVMYVGARLWGREAGFYAFLVLSSSMLYLLLGHFITLDMTISVFLGLGVGSLLLAQQKRDDPARVRNWMLLGWAMLGLAVLTKGLIGLVLPGGAIVIYTLWQGDWALWRHLHLGKGLLLLLLVTAPWFIAVSIANPEFPEFFFIHEHFDRYTSTVHRRDQPFWYFLPILLVGLLPWLNSGLRALFKPGFRWWPEHRGEFDSNRFLWVFAVFILLFFSLGRSMLPAYILPLFPALALLVGRQLAHRPGLGMESWALLGMGVVALILALAADRFATDRLPVELLDRYRYWVLAAALVMIAGGWITRRYFSASGQRAAVALTLSAILGVQILSWGYQDLGEARSSRKLAQVIEPYAAAGARVYGVSSYPQSLPFYLKRTIQLALTTGELAMGIRQEPEKWIADWDTFLSHWMQEEQAVAVFSVRDFNLLDSDSLPGRIIYRDPRKLAVVRR